MISALILDFDGVILESVAVKTGAFRRLFSFAPKHLDEIIEFHLQNGGMSRFDKFRYIYAHILNEELDDEKFAQLSSRFSALVFDAVVGAPFVKGAYEFLERFHRILPLYIVSATPEPELLEIIRRRSLEGFFRKVYGAPRTKADCIREILETSGAEPKETLFVGDAPNDWQSARETGVRFVARLTHGEPNRFINLAGVEWFVTDLNGLRDYILEAV
ncbi:putative haloacid dehalogenase-like hydrolase [hydrocarbon metagenome]|uniref:Putative haloacid dehalogenase-like hydrolase n=1 Tax=hydrocarbon metagenome TaxID=938273 RepID=A0A0W8FI44_9ZZZZ